MTLYHYTEHSLQIAGKAQLNTQMVFSLCILVRCLIIPSVDL